MSSLLWDDEAFNAHQRQRLVDGVARKAPFYAPVEARGSYVQGVRANQRPARQNWAFVRSK